MNTSQENTDLDYELCDLTKRYGQKTTASLGIIRDLKRKEKLRM
jgi:hypothetical protein